MFERLTERFQAAFRTLSGRARLTESNIGDAMREVRRALLDADVNYQVAKDFVATVHRQCLGDQVLKSVAPGQQAIKVVSNELIRLLGDNQAPLELTPTPAGILLIGLHGSGKTTTAAKLGLHLQSKHGKRVLLVAADLYRPAAIEQLETLGTELDLPVFADRETNNVAQLAAAAQQHAAARNMDVAIFDTAGRLQIDTDLVAELVEIKRCVRPLEILLVADAALGQEAVSVAEHFDKALGITGILLTKLDGDARGGAAVSMRRVTGKPIKFVGTGERLADLEPFHPDRMASRILGMGDVVSLVEKAEAQYEEEEAQQLEEKLRRNTFDLDDFRDQMQRIRKMGGIMSLLDLVPGMGQIKDKLPIDGAHMNRVEGIICSMTPYERRHPDKIDLSRRRRISRGSGVDLVEVNQLLKQFQTMRQMMAKVGKRGGMPEEGPGLGSGGLGGFDMHESVPFPNVGLSAAGSVVGTPHKQRKKRPKPARNKKKKRKRRR